MNVFCPHCGSELSVTWITKENNGERSIVRSNDALTAVQTTLTERSNSVKGLGVSGSDLDSGSDPDPSKQIRVPISTGKRGRKDRFEYPLSFLVLWDAAKKQGKPGNKFPAFKSWETLNADAELNALILERFEAWCKTDSWKRGFNQHFVTWLNQRGWEEPPTAADLRGTEPKNGAPSANGSATRRPALAVENLPKPFRCTWHEGYPRANNPQPVDWCPSCKEQKARNGARQGEPVSAADALPLWARGGKP